MTFHLDHNTDVRHHVRSHLADHVDDATLLILEELIMSTLTPIIDQLVTKVATLKSSNDALTAAAVEKDVQVSTLTTQVTDLHNQITTAQTQAAAAQAQLATAQANAFDPVDVQKLQDMLASLV